MTFSMVHRLFIGLKEPMLYIGLPFFCLGVILSILKMSGNFLLKMMRVVRCVINEAIMVVVLFSIFIEMLSCPTECLHFDFLIICVMSAIVGIGMVNSDCALGYIFFSISIGVTGMLGILLQRSLIMSI